MRAPTVFSFLSFLSCTCATVPIFGFMFFDFSTARRSSALSETERAGARGASLIVKTYSQTSHSRINVRDFLPPRYQTLWGDSSTRGRSIFIPNDVNDYVGKVC